MLICKGKLEVLLSTFLGTFFIALILIVVALLMIGLSWLVTGKQKIKGGSCGRLPKKEKDETCGTKESCRLCQAEHKKEEGNSHE